MRLPPERADPDWSRARDHDLSELWNHSRAAHVAASYAARLSLVMDLARSCAPKGGRVLDVGSGKATLGLLLGEDGYRVTLLELREGYLDYARARHERGDVSFQLGSLSAGSPPDDSFDLVLCTEVLEHVPAPGQFLSLLASKARAGARVIVTTPNADYCLSSLPSYGQASQSVIDGAEPNSADGDDHRYLFTASELSALIRGAGLKVEKQGFFLPFWLEGHVKTRYVHGLHYRLLGRLCRPPATAGLASRRLCSSQWLLARKALAGP